MARPTLLTAALVAAVFVFAAAPAVAQRSGVGPCRQGALALISMLDSNEDNTPDYRQAYAAVVETCGLAGAAPRPGERKDAPACRALALKLLDLIEDSQMFAQAFVQARNDFAVSCAPR